MARANKQEELMNTTYVVVAENGIDTFSMKTVTTRLGVSEGLIYKYFDTREGLLFKSFVAFEKQIAELFEECVNEKIKGETSEERRKRVWMSYYNFFLENNYKSLFYFEYRWSYRFADYRKAAEESGTVYISVVQEFAKVLLGHPIVTANDREEINWIIENTSMYAKRALLGEIKKDEATATAIYNRIFYGVGALAG